MAKIPTSPPPVNLAEIVRDICMSPPPVGHRIDSATDEATVAIIKAAKDVGILLTSFDARLLACAATEAALLQLAGGRAR